ncbi:3-hydroxyacyl-CoA dehydrogenase family protein [Citreicella sp. C3M06]|uniref:3-hydroxyacyl-CoA dehydrogenase family protein n=1 Tax=Citreicella sp. C3M06 TaxID=2841564 RepID=UPI001C08C1D1|nr:3-hydroxyacyl-CoA dehydrogenase family protein [Citreicella sp. C3M06]MBU2960072.1 3-hydroxyacyl-CoA dehydrogenase family protein [Citreicella sp. C3M06]
MKHIETIAVIGAGTMGHGIAETFAIHGHDVRVYDPDPAMREKALSAIRSELGLLVETGQVAAADVEGILGRISYAGELETAVAAADFVIEAIPEDITLKRALFANLDQFCAPGTILASNTSSLDLQEMIVDLPQARQADCMICHWYNPAHLVPLVELSDFGGTAAAQLERVEALLQSCGKKTIRVLRNLPGLIANRIQQGIAREVFALIEAGAASPEDIDNALKYGPAFRYATTGQLEIADFGGIDIWCAVGDNLLPQISAAQEANDLLRRKIAENKLGLKTGEGFFHYGEGRSVEVRATSTSD